MSVGALGIIIWLIYWAANRDRRQQQPPQGSGLGLAITSEVCRRAGFILHFAREAPRGLRVTVTGPRLRSDK